MFDLLSLSRLNSWQGKYARLKIVDAHFIIYFIYVLRLRNKPH